MSPWSAAGERVKRAQAPDPWGLECLQGWQRVSLSACHLACLLFNLELSDAPTWGPCLVPGGRAGQWLLRNDRTLTLEAAPVHGLSSCLPSLIGLGIMGTHLPFLPHVQT